NCIYSHCRRVKEHIYKMVIQKINLIYIQDTPVSKGEYPRLKALFPFLDSMLYIKSPYNPVFSSTYRQIRNFHFIRRNAKNPGFYLLQAFFTHFMHIMRIT